MVASMHIELLPPAAHELVRTATTPPRQDLLHGYWNEIMVTPNEDISERLTAAMAAIRSSGIPNRHVSRAELEPAYRRWLESALPDVTMSVFCLTAATSHT